MREERINGSTSGTYIKDGVTYDHLVTIKVYTDKGTLVGSRSFHATASGQIDWSDYDKRRYDDLLEAARKKEAEETEEKKEEVKEEVKEETEEKKEEVKEEVDVKKDYNKNSSDSNNSTNNKNFTDPIVQQDPSKESIGIAVRLTSESIGSSGNEEGIKNTTAHVDTLKVDGKKYPLLVINNRNIKYENIVSYKLCFDNILPLLYVKVKDDNNYETNLNTSGMSGKIKTGIVPEINNIYRNIVLEFNILSVEVNKSNNIVSYVAEYNSEKLNQTNTGLLYLEKTNNKKANTWEMLYRISELTGLGFASTKNTETLNDRFYRNIFTERFSSYIKNQIQFAGADEESVLDAWIDPYNYIVLVNVSWLLSQDITTDDIEIIGNVGLPVSNDGTGKQEPVKVPRILTNFKPMKTDSNLIIKDYKVEVNNDSIYKGTLERVYSIDFVGKETKLNTLDIQTTEDSVDGKYLEEYNTGSQCPIPKFNFNEDYDLEIQKSIRKHFFRKKRQTILNVTLENINLGLQRGTLIGVSIWEDNPGNKQIMIMQESNLQGKDTTEPDEIYDGSVDAELGMIQNLKLSDIYYIDAIYFEYTNDMNSIKQTLKLIKKGQMSGYDNTHTSPRFIEPKTNNK